MTTTARADLPGAHRDRRNRESTRRGNVTLLVAAALTMLLVPAQLAFGTSGLSFRFPTLVGLVGVVLLAVGLLVPSRAVRVSVDPVLVCLMAWTVSNLFTFGRVRSLPLEADAVSASTRSLVLAVGSAGLGLLVAVTLRAMPDARRVLVVLVGGGALSAVVALGQKLFEFNYASLWRGVPGLQTSVLDSGGYGLLAGRTTGTAGHPIELSVVSSVLLAFALHLAVHHPSRRARQFATVATLLLFVGVFLAISRSGFIAVIVVLAFRFVYGNGRQRAWLAVFVVAGVATVEILSPRSLSTLRYQLLHIGSDESSRGRTSDYAPVLAQWREHPWWGGGFGLSDVKLRILDNAWLGLLANGGVVGVVLLAAIFLVTIGKAVAWSHASRDAEVVSLAGSTIAAMWALAICAYFFDELSFYQAQSLVFVVAGLAAAAPRAVAAVPPRRPRRSFGRPLVPLPLTSRTTRAVGGT